MHNKKRLSHDLEKEYDSLNVFVRNCDFEKMITSLIKIAVLLSSLDYYYEASIYYRLANSIKNDS